MIQVEQTSGGSGGRTLHKTLHKTIRVVDVDALSLYTVCPLLPASLPRSTSAPRTFITLRSPCILGGFIGGRFAPDFAAKLQMSAVGAALTAWWFCVGWKFRAGGGREGKFVRTISRRVGVPMRHDAMPGARRASGAEGRTDSRLAYE